MSCPYGALNGFPIIERRRSPKYITGGLSLREVRVIESSILSTKLTFNKRREHAPLNIFQR